MAAKTNAKRTGSTGSSPKKAAPKGGSVNKSRGNAPSKADPPRKASAPNKSAKGGAPPRANGGTSKGSSTGVRIAHAEFMAGAAEQKQIPNLELTGGAPEIAFAGRSNVGKSSLLNMMLARRGLARTSNTPGCTRQINFFDVTVANARKRAPESASNGQDEADSPDGPQKIVFVDLPGYGYAKVSKSEAASWQRLLEGYLEERSTLRAVIVLVDVRRGLEEEERELVEFLATRQDLPVFVAATKLDKLSLSAQKPALAVLSKESGVRVVGTSAESGAGREDLWSRILYACGVQSSR